MKWRANIGNAKILHRDLWMAYFIPNQRPDEKTVEEANSKLIKKARHDITRRKRKTSGLPTRFRGNRVTRDVLVLLGFHAISEIGRTPGPRKHLRSLGKRKPQIG